jgi:hypothetical protein
VTYSDRFAKEPTPVLKTYRIRLWGADVVNDPFEMGFSIEAENPWAAQDIAVSAIKMLRGLKIHVTNMTVEIKD